MENNIMIQFFLIARNTYEIPLIWQVKVLLPFVDMNLKKARKKSFEKFIKNYVNFLKKRHLQFIASNSRKEKLDWNYSYKFSDLVCNFAHAIDFN